MPPAATHNGQTIRQAAKSKDVVKPVLSNPYATPWPTLPNSLQTGVMAALPQLIPVEVADYHVSRARCSQAAKRARRKSKRAGEGEGEAMDVDVPAPADPLVPVKPEILDHLVLGLNEVIRALEQSIDALRIRMALLSDGPRLLPTAPSDEPAEPAPPAAPEPEVEGITFLLVPHMSVSPLSLVDPLPTYVATYNTLLRQAGVRGGEIRVVPLGNREADIAAAAGLRRLTSVGVRASHPAVHVLERLLSSLAPPRHSMTLPWSTKLTVHTGEAEEAHEKEKTRKVTAKPAPVDYAPLHIKAVHTTAPVDPSTRKAQRLAEVRQKRVDKKAQRVAERKALEKKTRAEAVDPAKRAKGKAERRKARAAKLERKAKAVAVAEAKAVAVAA